MWSPFKKKTDPSASSADAKKATPAGLPDPEKMGFFERMAYKRFMAMSPQEQKKTMEKMLTPKNVEKHKDEILAQLEEARKAGQMSDDQYRLARRKLGI